MTVLATRPAVAVADAVAGDGLKVNSWANRPQVVDHEQYKEMG